MFNQWIIKRAIKLFPLLFILLLPAEVILASEASLSKQLAGSLFTDWLEQVIAVSDLEIKIPLVKLKAEERLLPEELEVLRRWLDSSREKLAKADLQLAQLEEMLDEAERRLKLPLSLSSTSYLRGNYGQSKSFNLTHELFLRANPIQGVSLYSKISTDHNIGQWALRNPSLHELTISVQFPKVASVAGWVVYRHGPLLMQRRVDKDEENQDPSRGFYGLKLNGRQQKLGWTLTLIPLSLGKGINYDRYLTMATANVNLPSDGQGSLFYLREFSDLASASQGSITAASNIIYALKLNGSWNLLGRAWKADGQFIYNEYDAQILKEPGARKAFVYDFNAETKLSSGKLTVHSQRIDPSYENPYSLVRNLDDEGAYIYRYEEPEYSWEEEPYIRNWQQNVVGLHEFKIAKALNLSLEMKKINEIRPSVAGLPRHYGHLAVQTDSTLFKKISCSLLAKNYYTRRDDDADTLDEDPVAIDCLQREVAFGYGPMQLGLRYLWTAGIDRLQVVKQFEKEAWLNFHKRLGAVNVELNLKQKQAENTELELYLRRALTDKLNLSVRQEVTWQAAKASKQLYAVITARF